MIAPIGRPRRLLPRHCGDHVQPAVPFWTAESAEPRTAESAEPRWADFPGVFPENPGVCPRESIDSVAFRDDLSQ